MHKDAAEYIKKEVDSKPEFNQVAGKGPWHCIIGKSFAAAVSHERKFATMIHLANRGLTV